LTYGLAAVVFLLLLWWGPTVAFRDPISLVVIAMLMAVGTESLRRQVAREFPDAHRRRVDIHSWWRELSNRVSERLPSAHAALAGAGSHADAVHNGNGAIAASDVELIGKLADLRDRGALTKREFDEEKRHILRAFKPVTRVPIRNHRRDL
jgi:hypothetical protein